MNVIQRRRFIALGLFVLVVGSGLWFNGWQYSPFKWMLDAGKTLEGTFISGDPYDEWVFSECDGEEQQVVVLQNGKLLGVSGLDSLRNTELETRCDLPLVDHPNLESWQQQYEQLNYLTAGSHEYADDILQSALNLSLSSFYLKPLSDWAQRSPDNAAAFLDAVANRSIKLKNEYPSFEANRRDNLVSVINKALDNIELVDIEQQRINGWLSSEFIKQDNKLLLALASSPINDAATKAQLLEQLKDISRKERTDYYLDIATSLIAEPQYARLLVKQLGELPSNQRLNVTRQLLSQPTISDEFTQELLRDFDDAFYGEQVELDAFIAIANAIKDRPNAPQLLAQTLPELSDLERRKAAVHLISLDSADTTDFTRSVLYAFDSLHQQSKPKVITAILASPQFKNSDLQQACLDAILLETSGRTLRDLASQMLLHPLIDNEVGSRIRIAVNSTRIDG